MNSLVRMLESLSELTGKQEFYSDTFGLHEKGVLLKSSQEELVDSSAACLFPFLRHDIPEQGLWSVYALPGYPVNKNAEGKILRATSSYVAHTDVKGQSGAEVINFLSWPVSIVSIPEKRTAFILGQKKNVLITTIRLIRQIVFFQLELSLSGFVLLHASALSKNGRATAFFSKAGDRDQEIHAEAWGKTLALASCLFLGNFQLLTDDLLPCWIDDGNAYVCGYPDYLDLKMKVMESLFPTVSTARGIRREDFGEDHIYLSSLDLKEAYGITVAAEESLPLETFFFVDLRNEGSLPIYSSSVADQSRLRMMIGQSLRLDHLFNETYNPNWLGLPRKSLDDFRRDASDIAEILARQCPHAKVLQGKLENPNQILEIVARTLLNKC